MTLSSSVQMDHPTVKTIICSGTPYEIGFQHGRGARDEIHKNIITYTAFFQETAKVTWAEAKGRATAQFVPTLDRLYPEILEEMAGIAHGVGDGLTRDDILTLNVRSEIALTNYTDGCTSFSQLGAVDANEKSGRKVWLAQNWDWLEELYNGGMVMLDIRPHDSDIRLKFVGEGGIIGKMGLNNKHFGICINALRAGAFNAGSFPVHVMSRRLLQYASSVDDAVGIINKFGTASTVNFMLADATARHLDIECSPKGNAIILPHEGFVAHTNHVYAKDRPAGLWDHPAHNSFDRLARIRELTEIDQKSGIEPTYTSLRKRLSDEQGTPVSICRDRPPNATGMERMTTIASIIMELKSGTAKVLIGRPCQQELPVVEWSI